MAINGVHSLTYRVGNVGECVRFFEDFGLPLIDRDAEGAHFKLVEGSNVFIRHRDDPALPTTAMVGDGVCEVIWGVDTAEDLEKLTNSLAQQVEVMPTMPLAAATSSAHLAAILFPRALKRLYVARDDDPAGHVAVTTLTERAEPIGIEVIPLVPHLGDFNDDLQERGSRQLALDLVAQLHLADVGRFLE